MESNYWHENLQPSAPPPIENVRCWSEDTIREVSKEAADAAPIIQSVTPPKSKDMPLES